MWAEGQLPKSGCVRRRAEAPPAAGVRPCRSAQHVSGRDVAGAGFLLIADDQPGVRRDRRRDRALVGAVAPLTLVGFGIGFVLGIATVIRRFRDV